MTPNQRLAQHTDTHYSITSVAKSPWVPRRKEKGPDGRSVVAWLQDKHFKIASFGAQGLERFKVQSLGLGSVLGPSSSVFRFCGLSFAALNP